MSSSSIEFNNNNELVAILGINDCHLRLIESAANVIIKVKEKHLEVEGEGKTVKTITDILTALLNNYRLGQTITYDELKYAIENSGLTGATGKDVVVFDKVLLTTHRGKPIKPKSKTQLEYFKALEEDDLVFAIGPAGTGKTYLAVAMAIAAYNEKLVQRIVLTRPAVEAGERLGFLPGDLQEKINPYLRPLYDALYDMMEVDKVDRLLEKNIIEIAPLAFMRGRTINDAFIIMDEAQNTTPEQMKMFVTRIGMGSRVVITGDITQIDLPLGQRSGLIDIMNVLDGVDGIDFIKFDESDVVRHPLVQKIVRAYNQKRDNLTNDKAQKPGEEI